MKIGVHDLMRERAIACRKGVVTCCLLFLVFALPDRLRADASLEMFSRAYDQQILAADYSKALELYRAFLRSPTAAESVLRPDVIFRIGECQWYLGKRKEALSTWQALEDMDSVAEWYTTFIRRAAGMKNPQEAQ